MTCACGNPSSTWLCDSCVEAFEYRLAAVDPVVQELQALVPRLTLTATYGHRASGGQSMHAPAPVSVDAVSGLDALHRWLMDTCLRLAEVTRVALGGRSHESLSSYLVMHMPVLRALNWCVGLYGELDVLVKDCESAVREFAPKILLGPCETIGCGETLTAREGDQEARCRVCMRGTDIQAYRVRRAREALGDTGALYRAAQAVRYLNSKGVKVTTKDVENWVAWGTLTPAAHDDKGRKLYRLEDIYKRAARDAA